MARPIITLTTDFGASDHYVAAMKGVILSICPKAEIVDVCHEVTPYAIVEGAFAIAQAAPYFPRKTVHVVVVDPGVGSARRPILAEAAGHIFIGPDNGVLAMACARGRAKVRCLANARYFRQPVSATFHGRDIFAPAAAHVAAGVRPAQMGKLIDDYAQPAFVQPQRNGEHEWAGCVLKIDRFGNIVTNLPSALYGLGAVTVGRRKVIARARTYAEAQPGKLFVIAGSSGYLEISMNQGSAAQALQCRSGAVVKLTPGS